MTFRIFVKDGYSSETITAKKLENAVFMAKPNRKSKKTILRKKAK